MRAQNYLVTVFVDNKCVDIFFSEDLCELHVCRVLHKGCEIEVSNLRNMMIMPSEEVSSRETEKMILVKGKVIPDQVVCMETKTVYPSLDVCSMRTGINKYHLMSAITGLSAIQGHHYLFSSDLFSE